MDGEGDGVNAAVVAVPEVLKPISWLVGRWESTDGIGDFPTIKDFKYNDIVQFKLSGQQPLFAYEGSSSHPEKKCPMHLESGFLRARGSELSFMVAHNFGVVSLEEGNFGEGEIVLKSKGLLRMTGSKDPEVTQIERKFRRVSDTQMVQELRMATSTTPTITHHLTASYTKIL